MDASDRGWLEAVITRRLPLSRLGEALAPSEDDVKTVVDLRG